MNKCLYCDSELYDFKQPVVLFHCCICNHAKGMCLNCIRYFSKYAVRLAVKECRRICNFCLAGVVKFREQTERAKALETNL